MNNLSNLGLKIKKLREFRNISQDFMAKELKISQAQYSRLESGEHNLKQEQLERIAKLLKYSVQQIQDFRLNGNLPFISSHSGNSPTGIINRNINYYQIDPALEKHYQEYINSLKENIGLLKDKVSTLEGEVKALKTENKRLRTPT